ncbi:MAG: T9SS type A sorting domain-containing protein [Bacteroidia bacterium]
MKKIIIAIISVMVFQISLLAQATLTNFELRVENELLTSATTYQIDIYLYNKSVSSFELRAGTMSFWVNPTWRNSGTITPSVVSSNLILAQQTGTSAYTNGATDFFRRTIANVSFGAGTSVSAGSRVKLFTMLLTNTASFSTSVTPNFACKFSGTNTCGFTYTDSLTTASAIAVNGTTVTGTQTNCSTPIYWNGTQWNAGSTSAGVVSTIAPVSSKDVIVYNGTLTGAVTCRNYELKSGTTHTLGANTLDVGYNLTNNGTLSASSGTINLTGTQILQTSNQSVTGSAITVSNLGFGAASNGGTKTLATTVSYTGNLTQSGTAVLATGGYLTLKSNSSGTASIGQLSSGSAISGNITVERYLPSSFRRYRFLASPVVGGTTLQWRDNGATNSGRGIHITNSTGTVDASTTNQPSAFKYNESLSTGGSDLNSKWEAIDGNSVLNNGQGYRVYVRGDRTKSLVSSSDTSPNETTIWVSGTYPVSPVNIPITYNPTLGNGWNLVGNPFPSPIDWNASSGWTKTNIQNTIWIWNPISNSYGSFDGTTTVNSVTRYISSGQAFFIQATGSPALSITESVKVSNTPSDLFKAPETNTLRIKIKNDTIESDETVIRFMENKNDDFIANEDTKKIINPNSNIASYFSPDKYSMVNYLNKNSLTNKTVPLSVWATYVGNYPLVFSQMENFDAGIYIYLKDNYKNTLTDLRKTNQYIFSIDANKASTENGRLEVIFTNKSMGVNEMNTSSLLLVKLFPNPVNESLNISVQNGTFNEAEITIYSITGVEIEKLMMDGNSKTFSVQNLSSGTYFLKVNDSNGFNKTIKFVK